jgi:hypothetical protein
VPCGMLPIPPAVLAARIFPRTAVTWLAEGVRPPEKTSCGSLLYNRLECPTCRIGHGGSAGILNTWKNDVALGKERYKG